METFNKLKVTILAFLLFLIAIACNTNEEPVCSITSPENNELFQKGDIVLITVSADDPDGSIQEVLITVNENLVSTITSSPYSYSWNTSNVGFGNYTIKVEAIDDGGKSAMDEINIDIYDDNTFIDSRDDQEYQIIEIDEKIWFAENLNFDLDEYGVYNYDNNSANSDVYGKLYRLEWARESCPAGWHLPNKSEWVELIDFVGGEAIAGGKLKEADTTHWSAPNEGASNEYGFTALPGGHEYLTEYFNLNHVGEFWTSSYSSKGDAWALCMYADSIQSRFHKRSEFQGLSVRCVKD